MLAGLEFGIYGRGFRGKEPYPYPRPRHIFTEARNSCHQFGAEGRRPTNHARDYKRVYHSHHSFQHLNPEAQTLLLSDSPNSPPTKAPHDKTPSELYLVAVTLRSPRVGSGTWERSLAGALRPWPHILNSSVPIQRLHPGHYARALRFTPSLESQEAGLKVSGLWV